MRTWTIVITQVLIVSLTPTVFPCVQQDEWTEFYVSHVLNVFCFFVFLSLDGLDFAIKPELNSINKSPLWTCSADLLWSWTSSVTNKTFNITRCLSLRERQKNLNSGTKLCVECGMMLWKHVYSESRWEDTYNIMTSCVKNPGRQFMYLGYGQGLDWMLAIFCLFVCFLYSEWLRTAAAYCSAKD